MPTTDQEKTVRIENVLSAMIVATVCVSFIVGIFAYVAQRSLSLKEQAVDAAWSKVYSSLQDKAVLIPSVILFSGDFKSEGKHLGSYSAIESGIFYNLLNARILLLNSLKKNELDSANQQFDDLAARLFALRKNDPEIDSEPNLQPLLANYAEADKSLDDSVLEYNRTLKAYNDGLQKYPTWLWRTVLDFKSDSDYFGSKRSSAEKAISSVGQGAE
jgi:LemA protein